MSDKMYGLYTVGDTFATMNAAGGLTYIIESEFETSEVDFCNEKNVKVMVTRAIKTANGLYDIIAEKCNQVESKIKIDNIELFICMSALACEIYMKAILYYHGKHNKKRIKKHNLYKLFQSLPYKEQSEIKKLIIDIDKRLDDISDSFLELRYVYEYNKFNKEYFLIFDLMNVLYDLCSKMEFTDVLSLKCGQGFVGVE